MNITAASTRVTLLPDPEPRKIYSPVISVDDHLTEPADTFEGRVPFAFRDRAPRILERDDGRQMWLYENDLLQDPGTAVSAGRAPEEWSAERPARYDEMRPGCFDINARIRDLDINGTWASLCFPSMSFGFGGRLFATSKDPELGLACVRAWNDWHLDVWAGTHPGRIIPMQMPWMADPEIAASEIRRNADRGFRAVTFVERPDCVGFPSMQSTYWDPFLQACQETSTVICLHVGSGGTRPIQREGMPMELSTSLFMVNAMVSAADWLWSLVPLRFPHLKIALSEGGMGWVPTYIDRLDYVMSHSARGGKQQWPSGALSPSEVLRRNFWFCTIDDPSAIDKLELIGVDHVMLETDYPHADSTWPDTQELIARRLGHLPADWVAKISHRTAARLFRHPLPPADFRSDLVVSDR
jgi:predicted TIM-barrel fold metal-dependent hydrolase